ncbi:hypothetical protein [Falsiroseomonas ponticola]|uniref:hypothetical protein n=1 Tax=Falsiroseomonas ponticola TaxID=2786951 RepID=UPI0019346501|nr:hypothetical protein [Roseomonas ponticola]
MTYEDHVQPTELNGAALLDTQVSAISEVAGPAVPAVTRTELETAIKSASTAYVSARNNAANAAATVYYIWLHACSEHASAENKQWYEGKRAGRQAEITAWNAALDKEKAKEEDDNKKKLKALRDLKRAANDPDRVRDLDGQITAQQEASKERIRALTKRHRVSLETRADAAKFTEITKLVLELDQPKQSSQVNRFATVVQWIENNYAKEAQPSIEKIAKHILDQGGFDNVYEHQRDSKGKSSETKAAANPAASSKSGDDEARQAVVDHFRNVVASAGALATLPLNQPRETNSLVALIGRVGKDGVTVISEVGMPVDKLLDLCVAQRDQTLLPGDAGCEFLATALAAGKLVEDGNRVSKGGEIKKITRELSILANPNGGRLVISALNTNVSVVVHATPKQATSGLLRQPGWWKLEHEQVAPLEQRLEDGIARKMVTLRMDDTPREVGANLLPSPFAWETTSGPLATKGDTTATLVHPWLAMSPHEIRPLDIEGFSPAGTVTLSRNDLLALAKGRIANWLNTNTKGAAEKKSALATVTISRSMLKVESVEEPDLVPCGGNMRGTVSLKFRPRVLAKPAAPLPYRR